jgi:hypothetical protein
MALFCTKNKEMKKFYYLFLTGLIFLGLNSCKKDSQNQLVTRSESLSLGAGYSNDIFYRLSDGLTTSVPRANWDIAFSVAPREAAILTNGAAGVTLKVRPTSVNWTWSTAIDTTGYSNWATLYNSDTTWLEGAFNMNATGHPNYGWGKYNDITHNLAGVALYIIKTRSGSYKKFWIENKLSVDQKYSFRYADINGSNEKLVTVNCAGKNKNFVYYSIDTNAEVDREPDTNMWDIVFTKWIDKTLNYPVTGVLQNIGVGSQKSTNIDPTSKDMPASGYLSSISTIGADWKTINMTTYQYSIDETHVFMVKDLNKLIYKIKFNTFEGSATGKLTFSISTVK